MWRNSIVFFLLLLTAFCNAQQVLTPDLVDGVLSRNVQMALAGLTGCYWP